MATTKSKTTTKSTTSKATTKATKPAEVKVEVKKEEAVEPVKEVVETVNIAKVETKKFNYDDLIQCRSVRYGSMVYISTKTNTRAEWSDYGDIAWVTYGDLLSMVASKSIFVYGPWFIVEDEDVVEALKLTSLYEGFKKFEDVISYINDSTAIAIRNELSDAPAGFKDAVAFTAARMVRDGELDSISKINAIEDALNRNLSMLISGDR